MNNDTKLTDAVALLRRYNAWRRDDGALTMPDSRQIGIAIDAVCDAADALAALKDAVTKVTTPKRLYEILRPGYSWSITADQPTWERDAKLIRAAIDAAKGVSHE